MDRILQNVLLVCENSQDPRIPSIHLQMVEMSGTILVPGHLYLVTSG